MTTSVDDLSLTCNQRLAARGLRRGEQHGYRREIVDAKTGAVLGELSAWEASNWMNDGCPAIAEWRAEFWRDSK